MLNRTDLEKSKKEIEQFFQKMTFEVEIELFPQGNEALSVNLKSHEPQILIGEKGETLFQIQHLLRAILKRKINTSGPFFLDLDIENYKKKKINHLREIAKEAVEEVILTKKEKILPPMPAYERRIIHLELAGRADVTSESVGQEPKRRVVIRPYP